LFFATAGQVRAYDLESPPLVLNITATVYGPGGPPVPPALQLKGLAAPSATVQINRNSILINTLTAATDARFDISLTNQPTGSQVYEISAIDVDGRALTPMTFALNLVNGSTTIIVGIFLGPSITADKATLTTAESVTVSGMTAPTSSVILTISSVTAKNYTLTADAAGRWSRTFTGSTLGQGTHTARARANTAASEISEYSQSVTFAVNPVDGCAGKTTADLNCDGSVNLTDFSILLYYWQKTNPANARADINRDGRVTIIDFSIMLYQWTG
jgi:hypothetical protein